MKELKHSASGTATAIASAEEKISALAAEIADYKALVQSDSAANELLLFAKNRLNKFYNPKLYKPPAKEELSAEGAIERDMSFVQLSLKRRSSIEPPPSTWDAYAKKSEESTGVVAMIDLLVQDMDKEMQEAEVEEKNAQEEYDKTVADAKG